MGKERNVQRPQMLEADALRTEYQNRAYTFRQLSSFAPEEWLVYDDGPFPDPNDLTRFRGKKKSCSRPKPKLIGYLRLRHGYFTASWTTGTSHDDMKIGKDAYEAKLEYEFPCFFDWNERVHYLSNALMALTGTKESLPGYTGKPMNPMIYPPRFSPGKGHPAWRSPKAAEVPAKDAQPKPGKRPALRHRKTAVHA